MTQVAAMGDHGMPIYIQDYPLGCHNGGGGGIFSKVKLLLNFYFLVFRRTRVGFKNARTFSQK